MTDSAEIARLKAEAAQAAAEAAAAKAQAAQAALDAALAAQAGQGDQSETASQAAAPEAVTQQAVPTETPAAPVESEPTAPAEASASEGELQGYAEQVRAGYSFTAPSMRLGAFLDGDTPVPGAPVGIPLGLMNRHCLVAGATGTGKTRTLQLMAERLSEAGVPVFVTDIKGDLTGLAQAGSSSEKLLARCASIGQNWEGKAFPTELLTLGGRGEGVPIRTTITEFGPLLLSRVLGLNDTQSSALQLIFHWADGQNLALIDLKDLRAVIDYLTNNDEGKEELKGIGGVSPATAGVIFPILCACPRMVAASFPPLSCPIWAARAHCSRPSSCGSWLSFSRRYPKWAIRISPSWSSSSTRPTCSSPMRPSSSCRRLCRRCA